MSRQQTLNSFADSASLSPSPLRLCVQAANELGDDIGVNSLSSRLVLLALHFPRLRLIWSRSLHATAAIFRDLKANMDEPDPVRAAAIGASNASSCTLLAAKLEIPY